MQVSQVDLGGEQVVLERVVQGVVDVIQVELDVLATCFVEFLAVDFPKLILYTLVELEDVLLLVMGEREGGEGDVVVEVAGDDEQFTLVAALVGRL